MMPVHPLKIYDLELSTLVLRRIAAGERGAFAEVAKTSRTAKANVFDAFDRVEKHFGVHLIKRRAPNYEERTGEISLEGAIVLKHGPRLLWIHGELVRDLAQLRRSHLGQS